MKRLIFCALLSGLPFHLAAQTYECNVTNRGAGGWIPEKIFIEFKAAEQRASVYDFFINQVHKEPIDVAPEKRGETSYELSWKVRNVKISNEGSGILSHSLILNTAANTYTMKGRLHGYDNVIRGSGTCKVLKK
ncbi:hypothetical protein OS190_14440 [Sulfitobacter sp. F26204]|uniref:hypothetical protein n=1 Tax=Sulfitobacter sp. F26204 TaxID=2996014 RepID=UPI00225E6697|nr:hypothetical protein [Sulfitobacter sp. F26204]MCX7560772.1 hypothetical protein [Sulfitobacter sp. F26204]